MMSLELGFADIVIILPITIGLLRAAIVHAKLIGGQEPAFRREVAIRTGTVATIACLLLAFAGHVLLGVFHISLPALKIAGGLILLPVALHMIMGDEKEAAGESA
jgi:multiple antibiotic resistance protein